MTSDLEWQRKAACSGCDYPNAFHPNKTNAAAPAWMRQLCNGCPVNAECLIYATRHNMTGLWAATNDEQRAQYRHTNPALTA